MSGPGFFSRVGQVYLCLLALGAAFGGVSVVQNFAAAERTAIESCDSIPERKEIALGLIEHQQQKLLVCPPLPKTAPRVETPPSREGRPAGTVQGLASWYGGTDGLSGVRTASGGRFDPLSRTAAHRSLPFGTRVRVTFLATGRSTVVRINDRGPASAGRIIDISRVAAEEIGLKSYGVGEVTIEVLP